MTLSTTKELLSGWGLTPSSMSEVSRPIEPRDVGAAISAATSRGIVARGLGRSYGDAALNAGGQVLDMTHMNRVINFDDAAGVVDAEAGVSLDQLMRVVIPRGWFVPVTPGTRYVTLGGAIAADVHGKNHHVDGSFGKFVDELELLKSDGEVVVISPEVDPEAFWATVGGMGLTGVILRATLRLTRVETSMIKMDEKRATDIDDLMQKMIDSDDKYRYSVAWIDSMAKGKSLGRGVLSCGDHATVSDLKSVNEPLRFAPRTVTGVRWAPQGLLNRASVSAFNKMWYLKASRRPKTKIVSLSHFFHPLDSVSSWNRLYGARGFLQYQFVIPNGCESILRQIVESISDQGFPSFLSVLKRFGQGHGYLSFPQAGWTLALDIPAAYSGLAEFLDGLDGVVADCGGRVYLAKDSRLRADLVSEMYPQIGEFRDVRERLDPKGIFVSDLSRRLGLT